MSRESRAGDVLVAPSPVATLYQIPTEMCCLWPDRDANPFALLFEGLWMLAGREDLDYVSRFIARMSEFSDDGRTLHGAYGFRWRELFGFDQLEAIAGALRKNPDCRRQVLQMWSPEADLVAPGKDVPCNTTVHFQTNVYGALDITVFNRSNDLVWGTYGADAVHFGMLLQYMAGKIGVPPGRYWQVSDNWHAYVKTLEPLRNLQAKARVEFADRLQAHSPYESGEIQALDMMKGVQPGAGDWDDDLTTFMEDEDRIIGYSTHFFKKVAVPLIQAHNAFKNMEGHARYTTAIKHAMNCRATDWRRMAVDWLSRRLDTYVEKRDG